MATDRTSKVVPEAKESLNKFKYEVAQDMGVKNLFIVIPQNTYNLKLLRKGSTKLLSF